ncbi:MAG: UDP-N-acetyl-D-glucosamine dehydrogenase [Nitrospinae bacterium CG11_big_fil_rev_8_21_14_0_20_45_15]|nr:MAG: UDP-N-acetyl-D-glucosamine dehydrogenase [Nitrospinae bacterium CG11_big_fil_rev_8_21_14_0_20_45_15]
MSIKKIENKTARIGVIGLGYVGLPILLEFGKAGFHIMGLDIDAEKIRKLSAGISYIRHISGELPHSLILSGQLEVTTDFSRVAELDCILICVPTPLNKNREPDLSYIVSTARQIGPSLQSGQLVVLESTVYPGVTRDVLTPELERQCGLTAGQDFFVAYSPEREDPANKNFSAKNIPRVVGADDQISRHMACTLYGTVIDKTVPVADSATAEATKLMENIFRSVNIALVNEMKIILDKMGIDVWSALDAAATKPFGFMPFRPGPGLGGHCIPIDPFYLTWKAREYGIATRFIELAGEVNVGMPSYVMQKIQAGLNRVSKSIRGSKIFILGLAYKKDVDDDRESVSYRIMDLLQEDGAQVEFNDPFIPAVGQKRDYPQFFGKKSVSLDLLNDFDMVVILTDHSVYDYPMIVEQSNIVVDTRNACGTILSDKIIKA